MRLTTLFRALAEAFDGRKAIEGIAADALRDAAEEANYYGPATPLPDEVQGVLRAGEAHPSCADILDARLPWAPPQTSKQADYIAHSQAKVHVELLGPDGLVHSDVVRMGVYGMLAGHEYGVRTHPAEEVFVMLAGRADWMRGEGPYRTLGPGERSHHASMLPHANRTTDRAFMSVYVWHGDISIEGYDYKGPRRR